MTKKLTPFEYITNKGDALPAFSLREVMALAGQPIPENKVLMAIRTGDDFAIVTWDKKEKAEKPSKFRPVSDGATPIMSKPLSTYTPPAPPEAAPNADFMAMFQEMAKRMGMELPAPKAEKAPPVGTKVYRKNRAA